MKNKKTNKTIKPNKKSKTFLKKLLDKANTTEQSKSFSDIMKRIKPLKKHKIMKKVKLPKFKIGLRMINDTSDAFKFRMSWYEQGYELIDITNKCEFKLGISGSCNSFNEPDETIYHIQCHYRNEPIANFSATRAVVLDDDKYIIFSMQDICGDEFIIFRKVKVFDYPEQKNKTR